MILAFLALASAPAQQTALDADRALAADAQAMGQWAAMRKWATPNAVMLLAKPLRAEDTLSWPTPREAVRWTPAASFVSCDGRMAANTGSWRNAGGRQGYYSTLWARRPDGGWWWTVDGGNDLRTPRALPAVPQVRRAACTGRPRALLGVYPEIGRLNDQGSSPDATLRWRYRIQPSGARLFSVELWNGRRFEPVIDDRVASASAPR